MKNRIVDNAYNSGRIPLRNSVYSIVESVLTPAPLVKKVIEKSSRDIVTAIKNPENTPDLISGHVILKNA